MYEVGFNVKFIFAPVAMISLVMSPIPCHFLMIPFYYMNVHSINLTHKDQKW